MTTFKYLKASLLCGVLLIGCGQLPASPAETGVESVAVAPTEVLPTEAPPTEAPPTEVLPTEVLPTEVPSTAEPIAAAAPAVADWTTVTSRVETELNAIGNPDAALTITEFSDFM